MNRPLVRIFSPFFPYPPTEGALQVILNQVIHFAQTHRVQLVCWKDSEAKIQARLRQPYIESFPESVELTVLEARLEYSKTDRLLRILKSLSGPYASVEEFYYPDLLSAPVFEKAQLEIFHYSFCLKWLERGYSNAIKRVSHFHNIESELFNQRARDEKNPVKSLLLKRFASLLRKNERKVAGLVDACWMLSQVDLEYMRENLSAKNLVLAPLSFSQAFSLARKEVREEKRKEHSPVSRAVFRAGLIGGLDFKPNEDSALFVLKNVCPEISRLGLQCEIIIAGKKPSLEIQELAKNFSFVKVLGFVEDIESFWAEIDCMLVPQLSGSGVRIKLLEAIASGIPVIANPEACAPLDDVARRSPLLHVAGLSEFGKTLATLAREPKIT